LRFTKFGEWRYGMDDDELPRGTRLVAHMLSLVVGWQKWVDSRPAEAVMGLIAEGYEPPPRASLGDNDKELWDSFDDGQPKDPWQFTNQLILSDPVDRELFTFSTSSRGGLTAIGELSKLFSNHMRIKPDEMPIVALKVGSYLHPIKSRGEIRFPIFEEVGWVKASELPAVNSGGSPEALPAPEEPPPAPAPQATRSNTRKTKTRTPF
jgi:hypothetical protein